MGMQSTFLTSEMNEMETPVCLPCSKGGGVEKGGVILLRGVIPYY